MNGPVRLGERLFHACVASLLASLALYGAFWLLAQIWPWLLGLGALAIVIRLLLWRQQRW